MHATGQQNTGNDLHSKNYHTKLNTKGEAPRADLPDSKLVQHTGPACRTGSRRTKETGQHPVPEPFMFIQTMSVGVAELANGL